tara:strand:- start:3741 stop:5150 length:1410 start_codon:yes stop_codon:yes gene_type:complete
MTIEVLIIFLPTDYIHTAENISVHTFSLSSLLFILLVFAHPVYSETDTRTLLLEQQIVELKKKLAHSEQALVAAKQIIGEAEKPASDKSNAGPITIGGAVRVNYVYGDYGSSDGPSRGDKGGNVELDTFRINLSLKYKQLIGEIEYRWYDGYNFVHTAWLGYAFDDTSQLQAGITRVPFGPGAYGVSQSYFFDQHYYLGLSDDMDFGLKYLRKIGPWDLALAYFDSSEGNWNGFSEDSARYSYDAVEWRSALDANGNIIASSSNGYTEKNQVNGRAIYHIEHRESATDIGLSLQVGEFDGNGGKDGSHWAASVHLVNQNGPIKLAVQLTAYEFNIDDDNVLGTDQLIPFGAFDFAWPVATKAWVPAISLSYALATPNIAWLDSITPYIEYSAIIKDNAEFNDSELIMLGAAWASGGWYIYSESAYSNGNLFIGDEGDNYANINQGVGDFGVNGNDKWNLRCNINFGYYF